MLTVSNRHSLASALPLNVVDLWFARLSERDFSFQALLSVDELRRACQFRFDRDAANFVSRRGILRLILATYTGVSPSQLSFTHNQFGKPALDGGFSDIRFSLSQSGELAVYAFARGRDLGVDLEHLRQTHLEIESIAGSSFSEKQITVLNETPADQKEEMFLRIWTRLEAQEKLRGIGIGKSHSASRRLNAFRCKCFSFTSPSPSPGYVVTVAVQGQRHCSLWTAGSHIPLNKPRSGQV